MSEPALMQKTRTLRLNKDVRVLGEFDEFLASVRGVEVESDTALLRLTAQNDRLAFESGVSS